MNSYYGRNFRTRTFADIFPNVDSFEYQVTTSKIPCKITLDSVGTLYYLLFANYGNSYIASSDENRFKYAMDAIIFQFGPTWEKRLELQDKLRGLTDEELVRGTKIINNHSYNPSTQPNTGSLEELDTINDQSTTNYKKSKLDAYTALNAMLEKDVTRDFIVKFKKLFLQVVAPEDPLWYDTPIDEDIIEN